MPVAESTHAMRSLSVLLFVASCRTGGIAHSEDVSSRDMHVAVAVNGEAGRTIVRALPMYLGGLVLTGGDRLVLRGESTMEREDSGYYAAISRREGGSFVVDLLRPSDSSITDLEVTVPPPFELKASRTTARWNETIDDGYLVGGLVHEEGREDARERHRELRRQPRGDREPVIALHGQPEDRARRGVEVVAALVHEGRSVARRRRRDRAMKWAAALLVVACGQEEPRDTGGFATNALSLQILMETNESTTKLSLGIYAEGHTYSRLALVAGEKLTVRVPGSAPIPFTQTGGGLTTYEAELGVIEGTVSIVLERGSDVATTEVDLPPPFAIEPPAKGISLAEPFTLRWSPASNDTVKLSIASMCMGAAERTLTRDPGAFTWSAADFTHKDGLPCTATIHVRRQGGVVRIASQLAGVQFFRAEQLRPFGVLASP